MRLRTMMFLTLLSAGGVVGLAAWKLPPVREGGALLWADARAAAAAEWAKRR